jgi:ABC-type lipoprotein export system ATPase subunit
VPDFLSDADVSRSEIWHREVCFRKDGYYLISATSGAGKSSFLSYLFGERTDYTGDITYDDRNIISLKPSEWANVRQNVIAFVFQGLRLFSELTAFENIKQKNRLTCHKTDDEIMSMLEYAGLAEKRNEKAARLSFGQQQRVAIIRALCQPFDFLLMDEPFSHLDNANIEKMTDLVTHELQSRKAGLLLCSLGDEYPFVYSSKFKV